MSGHKMHLSDCVDRLCFNECLFIEKRINQKTKKQTNTQTKTQKNNNKQTHTAEII